MKTEEWLKVEAALNAALELEPVRRREFLDQMGASTPELRREVESLLVCEEKADSFLAAPAIAFSSDFFDDDEGVDSRAGQTIGHYRILREIGRGGMGAVFLGVRADAQYQKRVAIKLVRRGMDSDDILRRFRNERQILASLDHPNIARLLDGGTTDDGLPYLVMEYVEGTPVTKYCDRQHLTTNERLELFRTICAAVQHAHQNLVVHRDLKPSNILITSDGTPKLLDFGIAKVLNPELSATSIENTRTELRVLTPDYASPEQLRGEQLTTASDVYSLGVVLYELLTGHHPYRATKAPPHELARIILDQEPTKPSTAVGHTEKVARGDTEPEITITPETVSRVRDTQPDKLRRRLAGDLDNIVLMALRKEPRRRYESASQLAADIGRHMDGLPVIARKDTFKYRATKFVRRNRLGVAAAVVILLSLLSGIAVSLWQVKRVNEQAKIAAHERDRARVEAAKAERINAFLQGVLGFSNRGWLSPNPQRNREATITDALNEASRRAETELADQPEVLAAVLFSLGQSYIGQQNKLDVAEQHLRKSLEIRRRVLGSLHQDTATSMSALGEFLVGMGKFDEAESLGREAVAVFRRARQTGVVNSQGFAISLNTVGTALISKGDAAGGEQFMREALEASANFTGVARAGRGIMYSNLSVALGNQGDIDGAIAALQMSLEEYRRVPGDRQGLEVGMTLGNLASFLIIRGDYAEAEPLLRESLDIHQKVMDGKHLGATWSLIYLADNYYLHGDYRRAREEVDRALEIQRPMLPEGHIDYARSWTVLGKILTRTNDLKGGESYLRRALELRTRALKPGHWRLAETQGALGENLIAQKRYSEAETLLVDSHISLNSSLSARDPRTQEARRRLVTLYEAWKKPEMAARFIQP
jgi:serine/threonine protein kinase